MLGIYAHLEGMIGGGIGIHTAFVAGGGTRFLPKFLLDLGWIAWVLPSILGIMAMEYYKQKISPME